MKSTISAAPARPRSRQNAPWRRAIPYVIGGALLLVVVNALRPRPVEVEVAAVT